MKLHDPKLILVWEEHKVLLNMTKMNFPESLGGLVVGSNIKKLLNIDEQSLYVDC
jgi:hypothetical protein